LGKVIVRAFTTGDFYGPKKPFILWGIVKPSRVAFGIGPLGKGGPFFF